MSLSNLYRSLCQEQQSRTGLSIRQVASTARLSPGTIDHFLAHGGTPSYDRLLAISDALRIARLRAQIALQVLGCPGSYYAPRSEEHTSELQSLMRKSYAVICSKKKK